MNTIEIHAIEIHPGVLPELMEYVLAAPYISAQAAHGVAHSSAEKNAGDECN